MQSPNIEPPNKSNHPPRPPSLLPPLPSSFSSLPEDIVMSCLSRISRSYYPKLSLVSKSFCSLVLSRELYLVRRQLKTQEECVYLSLRSPTHPCLIWYSLWINPDRHQTLRQCKFLEESTGNLLLVPVPSSYSLNPTDIMCIPVGSDSYMFGVKNSSSSSFSSVVRVFNKLIGKWRESPSMMVARKEPLTCVLDGKLYVLGGCRADEATYWAEVFDPKTQTWEPLPDPGPEVRFSSNIKVVRIFGTICVRTTEKNFVYLLKEKKWEVETKPLMENRRMIGDVSYSYAYKKWWWYDRESKQWILINGLSRLSTYSRNDTVLGTYGGKLVIFWDTPALCHIDQTKEIWCAVILLDKRLKRLNRQVWGEIQWVDIVLTVPESYTLVSCVNLVT